MSQDPVTLTRGVMAQEAEKQIPLDTAFLELLIESTQSLVLKLQCVSVSFLR